MSRLYQQWYKDCRSPEEKAAREAQVRSASPTLLMLKNLLTEKRDLLLQLRVTDYEVPSWQYKLAHVNGQIQEINDLIKLLDPLED